jgi:hypothetical protein
VHRALKDPAHPWVALNAPDEAGPLDPVTLDAVAALAAAQAVQHVEQRTRPGSVNALLHLSHDGATVSRRTVAPSSRCGCTWEMSPMADSPTMAG